MHLLWSITCGSYGRKLRRLANLRFLASFARCRVNFDLHQLLAVSGRAGAVDGLHTRRGNTAMCFDRVGCGLPSPQSWYFNHVRKLGKHIDVLRLALSFDNAFKFPSMRFVPSRQDALAARLVLVWHEETRNFDHAGVFVHNDQTARTYNRADFLRRVEIKRQIEMLARQASAKRTAYLNGLNSAPSRQPPPMS